MTSPTAAASSCEPSVTAAELLRLYAGMNHSLEQILGDYTDTELQVLADFLSRTAAAGGDATGDLAVE